ncbi:hypothetical protein DFQ28_005458 [Apophysomyces sp. BC1034]|nr:hypothetical protein DFQ30_005577 [Apophysomyces sp. BC1015]KAG0178913.1 hypothetical protein DFQ29_002845 [Apophysomyces sp. BC1021]KAG0188051.1 hypothetical protein DFQ28_005458 [Apophysomyces sp. BC1034]
MASSSLKIKLRLSAPSPTPSSSASSAKQSKDEDDVSTPVIKRAKPNPRSRKPFLSAEAKAIAAATGEEDGTTEDSQRDRPSHPVRGHRKDILKYKDSKARQWTRTNLTFRTLDGSEIKLPSWRTDERMKLNDKPTEPTSVAEIDQLFSSAGGEKDFRPFLCTQPGCSKSFTTFDQLQTHETNMHGTKKLICGIDGCHKSFVTPGQLTKHRKMVHFRAARKAKLAAAAAAAAAAESNKEESIPTVTNDEESVDIGNSEDTV